MMGSDAAMRPAMSIDVEDWFQVENLRAVVARDTWDERELRVERNTDRMLELMDKHGVKCTCFILGWVAEKCPALIRRIADAAAEWDELTFAAEPAHARVRHGCGQPEQLRQADGPVWSQPRRASS